MAYTLNIYFPQFWRNWRLGSPRSRCWQIEFLTTKALLPACSWQPSCSMVTWQRKAEAENETEKASSSGLSSSSYKDTNPIMGSPPLWPPLDPITSQRPHLQIPSHWRLCDKYVINMNSYEFGEDMYIWSMTPCLSYRPRLSVWLHRSHTNSTKRHSYQGKGYIFG